MLSHKLSLDAKCIVYNKDMQIINTIESPHEIETTDDTIDFLVREANGVILQKETIPFRSFTRNFTSILDSGFDNASSTPGTQSNNTKASIAGGGMFGVSASAAQDTFGILVGTSSVEMNYMDYKLLGKCVNGNAINDLNKLYYLSHESAVTITTGSLLGTSIKRSFINFSTSSVTILESGLMNRNASGVYYLMTRDVVQNDGSAINVVVTPDSTLDVLYNFYFDTTQGWLYNWVLIFGASLSGLTVPVITLSGLPVNTNYANTGNDNDLQFNITYAADTYPTGICVGSSNIPVSSSDYRLGQIIEHGSDVNQLTYGASIYNLSQMNPVSQSAISTLTRRFTNDSFGTVVIREVGVLMSNSKTSDINAAALVIRKVVNQINLQAEHTLDVVFTFNVSSSGIV
jgi:hypothetical protein